MHGAGPRCGCWTALRDGVDTSAPPDQQLWHGLLAVFTFVERERDSWAILLGEVTQGTGPFAAEGAAVRRELAALIAELLRRAAAAEGLQTDALGITDQLARALMGAGESLAVWWGEHPEQPVEQVALVLMNFAWNGLGGLVQGRSWIALVEPQHLRALDPVHPGVADALEHRARLRVDVAVQDVPGAGGGRPSRAGRRSRRAPGRPGRR